MTNTTESFGLGPLGIDSPEIGDQMNKLFSEILKSQQSFNKVVEPDPKKAEHLANALQEYGEQRGRGFVYSYLSSGRGHGPFSECLDGSVKYDLICAIGPNLLGHSHPLTIKAHLEAATRDTIMCGNLLPYGDAYDLSATLLDAVKDSKLKHFWYAGSGSFANDTALKMLWQKKAPAYRLLAFEKAFAGRSVATQDITHNEAYRVGMPEMVKVDHVPHFDEAIPGNSLENTLKHLDKLWEKHPNEYCALMIEPIQGEGGFITSQRENFIKVFEWAKEKGIYIWVDEVQTFGRTERLFSFQTLGLQEYVDICTVGKALQVCGTLYSEELNPKPGLVSGTFNGSLSAIISAKHYLNYLLKGNFYGEKGRIKEIEKAFTTRLEKLKEKHSDKIGFIAGYGTMVTFEVGDAGKDATINFVKRLFDNGVIAFWAGKNPFRVRFLLPLSLTDEHIDDIFSRIEKSLEDL